MARRRILLLVVASALVVAGVWWMLQVTQPTPAPPQRYAADVVAHSTDAPAENPPGEGFAPLTQGDEPAFLHVPRLGIKAPVQKVGIDQRGEVAVPSNIHFVGWFIDAAKPGDPGLSVIDGHLDGSRDGGVFRHLATLTAGDTFTVERANKQVLQYRVLQTKTVAVRDAVAALFSQDTSVKSQLNLITCTGVFDSQSRTYDQRTVVSARLVTP